jgi:GTP-binding protein EngB required for normal cell division
MKRIRYSLRPTKFQQQAKLRGIPYSAFQGLLASNDIDDEDDLLEANEIQNFVQDSKWSLIAPWIKELQSKDMQKKIFRVVVSGDTSDGKSSLINNLLGREPWGGWAPVGTDTKGKTKELTAYTARASWVPPGVKLVLYDMPGFSDAHVDNARLLDKLRDERRRTGFFDALVLCVKIWPLKTTSKITSQMIEIALKGSTKMERVAWVGTHGDLGLGAWGDAPISDQKTAAFLKERLGLLNKSLQLKQGVKHACVVDCQPLSNNLESPNVNKLRDMLNEMIGGGHNNAWTAASLLQAGLGGMVGLGTPRIGGLLPD